jgi:hypothetical protein
MSLTGFNSLVSTTVTTGVIANTYQMSTAGIESFAARFGSTFDEYRILGVDVRVRPVNAASGVSTMFFDEKSTSAPTLADAGEKTLSLFPNTNSAQRTQIMMRWRARDLLDLQYTAIGSTVTPVTFKIYTDTANFGAPTTVTPVWLVEPLFHIEFRGIKSV